MYKVFLSLVFPISAPRVLGAGYDPVQLGVALADEQVCLLVRLRSGRCFYAPPDPAHAAETGRPRRHGAKLVCADPRTWPAPTAEWQSRRLHA